MQNLIEAQFKVQLRLADFKFEQARTLDEVQAAHADFIETFNQWFGQFLRIVAKFTYVILLML